MSTIYKIWANTILGQNLGEAFSFLPAAVRDEYRRVFATGETLVTAETIRFDNRIVVSETRKIPVRENDQVTQVLTVVHDVTQRWRAEQLLRIQHALDLALGSTRDLGQVFECAMEAVRQVEGIESGGVYLLDGASEALDLAYADGLSAGFTSAVSHYSGDSPHSRLVLTGGPFFGSYPTAAEVAANKFHLTEGLHAVAVIPMRHDVQIVGCLNLGSHTHDEIPPGSRRVDWRPLRRRLLGPSPGSRHASLWRRAKHNIVRSSRIRRI